MATTPSAFSSGSLEAFGGQKYLALTVTRSAEVPYISHVVEVSSDLVTWTSGASSTVTLTNTPTQLVVRDNTPVQNASEHFMRLRISTE